MTENDGLRRYRKAGMTFTQVTRARADQSVRELIKNGEIERHKAQDWVENLVRTSCHRSDAFISTVRGEVRKPFKGLGATSVDDLAKTGGGDALSRSSASAHKDTGRAAMKTPAKKTAAKTTAARKAPASKIPATKTVETEGAMG